MSDRPECRPWPRVLLDAAAWRATAARADLTLIALWADTVAAHALYRDDTDGIAFVSVAVLDGLYPAPSASGLRRGASLFERALRDLWGHAAAGGMDARPWLDHGHWPAHQPMALRPTPPSGPAEPPEFLPDLDHGDAEPSMLFASGPVRGGAAASPAVIRSNVTDETIARAETRLGYAHRGALTMMRGQSPRAAARIAARLSAASTVAHSLAFSRAAEGFLPTPPRAEALRALMLSLERITGQLATLSANAPTKPPAVAREAVLRASKAAFGHRLMMDCVTPGGVSSDICAGGMEAIRSALDTVEAALPALQKLPTAGRGVGVLTRAQAMSAGADGVVGRASGIDLGGAAIRVTGDVAARSALRLDEIAAAIGQARLLLTPLPDGPVSALSEPSSGEGVGMAEGAFGECWHWLRLDGGLIAAAYARDPAWALWPSFEFALTGARADDAALIEASFGLHVAGMDL